MFQKLKQLRERFNGAVVDWVISNERLQERAAQHVLQLDALIEHTQAAHPWMQNTQQIVQDWSKVHQQNCPFTNPYLRDWWIASQLHESVQQSISLAIEHRADTIRYEAEDAVAQVLA